MTAKPDLARGLRIRTVRVRIGLAICAGMAVLNACQYPAPPLADLPRLRLSTQFGVENLCNIGVSPRIRLANVPAGTTAYVVKMTNISVLIQTPWREAIPAASKEEIPEGAGKTFVGPCIGDNTRFAPTAPFGYTYRVEVLAVDAAGKSLAYGWTNVLVQSPYLTARRMRVQQQRQGSEPPPPSTAQPQSGFLPGYGSFSPGVAPNFGLLQ